MLACKEKTLFCKLLGQECIGKSCAQFNERGVTACYLQARVGHFLYMGASPMDQVAFYRYLEEIRPEVRENGV